MTVKEPGVALAHELMEVLEQHVTLKPAERDALLEAFLVVVRRREVGHPHGTFDFSGPGPHPCPSGDR